MKISNMGFIKQSILCVEDDPDSLKVMKYLFESENFDVTDCDNLEDCLLEVKNNRFSAIVLDYYMGNQNSLEVCEEIRSLTQKHRSSFTAAKREKKKFRKPWSIVPTPFSSSRWILINCPKPLINSSQNHDRYE